jgi:hypothetical protein
VHAVLDPEPQHPVPRRIGLDAVDAVAVAIVRDELRDVAKRAARVLDRLGRAHLGAKVPHALLRPSATLAVERLAEGGVGVERVEVDERRRLIRHVMRY